MLHGANAYTVELAWGSQDAVDATVYGMMGNARFVAENKDELFLNQLERYRRGIENIDEDAIRPYYVDQTDRLGADADNFRPRYAENQNFFPEYYLIPLNSNAQRDRAAARDMVEYLIHNRVAVMGLDEDVILPANEFRGEVRCTAGGGRYASSEAKHGQCFPVQQSCSSELDKAVFGTGDEFPRLPRL